MFKRRHMFLYLIFMFVLSISNGIFIFIYSNISHINNSNRILMDCIFYFIINVVIGVIWSNYELKSKYKRFKDIYNNVGGLEVHETMFFGYISIFSIILTGVLSTQTNFESDIVQWSLSLSLPIITSALVAKTCSDFESIVNNKITLPSSGYQKILEMNKTLIKLTKNLQLNNKEQRKFINKYQIINKENLHLNRITIKRYLILKMWIQGEMRNSK